MGNYTKNKPAIEGGEPVRKDNFLIFGAPDLKQEDIDEVVDTLKSGWLSTGPKAAKFEEKFAEYQGAKYAVGTNSCTAALHLSIDCLDLPSDSEIITTDMTFCATVNSIIHAGLKPVLVDCRRDNCNIDERKIEEKITSKTKAIIPVHFAGHPCNMEVIKDIARRYGLYIIGDAAHAIETRYKGKSIAQHSDLACHSFYTTKNINTIEGGIVLTDNGEWADKIRMKALHGMSKNAHLRYGSSGFKHYAIDTLGYKYNMTDIAASLGLNQIDRVDRNWGRRAHFWEIYQQELEELPLVLPYEESGITHGYHLFTIQLDLEKLRVGRDFILNALVAEGIGTGVHYNAIHTHKYYREKLGVEALDFPNAQWVSERTLSLPMSSKIDEKDVFDVIEAVRKILNYYRK